jgi:hypothetical protein
MQQLCAVRRAGTTRSGATGRAIRTKAGTGAHQNRPLAAAHRSFFNHERDTE